MSTIEEVVQEAIEEWASTAFAPGAPKPNDPTLARYIGAKLRARSADALLGVPASHSIISSECRTNRGDEGAFEEAVARARVEFEGVCEGWRKWSQQPVIHLLLTVERPPANASAERDAGS